MCVSKLHLFTVIAIFRYGFAANILGLMGCASLSHHIWNEVIVTALAERGHTLTIVSTDISEQHHENIRYIHLEETYNTIKEHYRGELPTGPLSSLREISKYQMTTCKGVLQSKGFQEALALDESFDLVLYDIAAGPCLLKLITKYPRIPVVALSAYKVTPELLSIAGGHSSPAYIPLISNEPSLQMNYWERLYNAGVYAIYECYRTYVTDVIINAMASKQFPGDKTSPDDLYERINIFLVNTHPALDVAQSLPPNVIEVGGLSMKDPKPLPTDIDKFISSSKRGIVLISLGSNIGIEMLGRKNIQIFANVIERLSDYNFLWKVDKPHLVKSPPRNLLIREWFPQNDLLGHPKLKAFVTHAGGLSKQETIWHGVPVVAVPFFYHQYRDARFIETLKLGTVVDLSLLTEKALYQSLVAVLTNDVYRDNMKALQRKFRDCQNIPLDKAVWWIEYALRHGDLSHLVSDSRFMSYFVSNSVDVLLTVFVLVIVFLINLWVVLRNIKTSSSKTKKPSQSKTFKTKKVKRS